MAPRICLTSPTGVDLPEELMRRAAAAVLDGEGYDEAELSIACLPDGAIRDLNRRWLGHDWVPDVLAFALHRSDSTPLGDIYVGVEQAERQAAEHGVSRDEELARLVVHGALHVLGYDHADGDYTPETSGLHRKQEEILRTVMSTHSTHDPCGGGGGSGVGDGRADAGTGEGGPADSSVGPESFG